MPLSKTGSHNGVAGETGPTGVATYTIWLGVLSIAIVSLDIADKDVVAGK